MRTAINFLFLVMMISHLYGVRGSSYPFISGDTFKTICDHCFDETYKLSDPSIIQEGDTIFLKADSPYIIDFFVNYYPYIQHNFIVVSHNGDHSIPGLRTGMDMPPLNFNLMEYIDVSDSKVIRWFGQNIDLVHPKLEPIPIGIANKQWGHGCVAHFINAIQEEVPWDEKVDLIYLNFSVGTNRAIRGPIMNYFSSKKFCSNDKKRSHQDYLFTMKRHKFILCPPGNGHDCHRVWEALLLGCIPIVESSSLNQLYADLPIIIVEDWYQINPDFLNKKINEFEYKSFKMGKIYFDYWANLVNSYKAISY